MIKKILFILILSIYFSNFLQGKTLESLSSVPNPFTNFTIITFKSSLDSSITLTVRNILEKTVLKKTYQIKKGKNSIPFYKNNLTTGMYVYSIQNNPKVVSKRFAIK